MIPYYFIHFTVLPEVVMAATEVESAIFRFMSSLGQGTDWDPEEFDSICEMIPAFKFGILVPFWGMTSYLSVSRANCFVLNFF